MFFYVVLLICVMAGVNYCIVNQLIGKYQKLFLLSLVVIHASYTILNGSLVDALSLFAFYAAFCAGITIGLLILGLCEISARKENC